MKQPSSLQHFKIHQLYVLKRSLLKSVQRNKWRNYIGKSSFVGFVCLFGIWSFGLVSCNSTEMCQCGSSEAAVFTSSIKFLANGPKKSPATHVWSSRFHHWYHVHNVSELCALSKLRFVLPHPSSLEELFE